MKIFVWHRVGKCSNNYHDSGGVVAVAMDEARARELANAEDGCEITAEERPDLVEKLVDDETPERVYVMPDAGCC